MLDKKATEATNQILELLQLSNSTFHFVTIQPVILHWFETVYLHGRKDQVDRVTFEELPNGSLKFQDK